MKIILAALLLAAYSGHVSAKPSVPDTGFLVHLLGKPVPGAAFVSQIPQGEAAIAAIAETPDGKVLGGTRVIKGKAPWLFLFDPKAQSVVPESFLSLEKILPHEKGVAALVTAGDGAVYGVTTNFTDLDYVYREDYAAAQYAGGRLFRVDAAAGKLQVKDLGPAVKGECVTALLASKAGDAVYGFTAPSQILFALDLKSGKTAELGRLDSVEKEFHRYYGKAGRALIQDDAGNIYGTGRNGRFFKYSPAAKKLDTLSSYLPTEGEGRDYDCVSAFVRTPAGRIFGGTFMDGKLFEFFPKTGRVRDLGITSRTGLLSGLAEKGGVLYGLTGSHKSASSQIFAYNTATGEYYKYKDLKIYYPDAAAAPYGRWSFTLLRNLLVLKNGVLVTAEDNYNGHLVTYEPRPLNWSK